ncbi:MAG: GGDEF domain-containing protein [Clostridia bacterium]|jgi:diguanylate cyclase (GGDEF)-like protein|nr:GGDEF domain-containing protein [Clostridia bacterium]
MEMSVFLRVDINIAAFILLSVVLVIAYQQLDRQDLWNRRFLSTSLIVLFALFFETMTCIINKRPELWLMPVSVFMHLGLFITGPILTYSWYVLIHSWIIPKLAIPKKKHLLMLLPVIINFFIIALSPFFGWVFFINSANVYQRGPLFSVSAIITFFYLFCALLLILKHRKKIVKQEVFSLFIVVILPLLGGILQSLFYGLLFIWSSSAFALVITYNLLQQRLIRLDSLTGAWARESFLYFISQKIKRGTDTRFGAIYLDLDKLKEINDEYGHLEGDDALKTTIRLVKSLLRKTDVIARLGGDEFIIIVDCESPEILEKMIARIRSKLKEYNEKSGKGYKLECSFGADIFDAAYTNVEQFLHHIDSLMYSNKKGKSCGEEQ